LAFDLGLFGEQLLASRQDDSSWVPADLKESKVFPKPFEVAPSPLETSRHATELKTNVHHKTVPKPENKN